MQYAIFLWLKIESTVYWEIFEVQNFRGWSHSRKIFEDDLLVTIDNNGGSVFRVVKISRLQANPRKQRNYFTSKISQYTVYIKTWNTACNAISDHQG